MFKLTIFKKLFLVLLMCMLIISGTILTSVHWSFSDGFGDYLLKAEATQLDKLIKLIEQTYAKTGNWQSLQGNYHAWFDLLRQSLENQHLPPFPNAQPPGHHPPPPPPDGHPPPGYGFGEPLRLPPPRPHDHPGFRERDPEDSQPKILSKFLGSRLQLLDMNKNKVVGLSQGLQSSILRPIKQGDNTVGWLALQSSDLINNHLAQVFVKQQIRNNYQIAGLSFCLAILGSLIVTRKLVMPIRRITAGARALAAGNYATKININRQDELGQLANDFNLLAATLKRNEDARKHWIADISHELRTPLAILRGEIEAVQDGVRDLSPDNIQSLYAEVINLTQLVDDLYELSLSDLGSSHYQPETVHLEESLQEVIQSFLPRFHEKNLALHYHNLSQKSIFVKGDARRLRQLFVNVLENSRRYTQAGGFCEIQVNGLPQQVELLFEDTPPGVPDWSLSKLFDRLYRVDKSRNRELGGSGLGLAICKAIVDAHQGDIQAFHSRYGGVGIKIILPIKPKP